MSADLQRRGLASDLSRRLQLASRDELRVIDRLFARLELGRDRYGKLDITRPREWRRELGEELLDAVIYDTIETIAAEDAQHEELQIAASKEIAEWQADQVERTRASNVPAQLAGADPRDSYDELEIAETGGEG